MENFMNIAMTTLVEMVQDITQCNSSGDLLGHTSNKIAAPSKWVEEETKKEFTSPSTSVEHEARKESTAPTAEEMNMESMAPVNRGDGETNHDGHEIEELKGAIVKFLRRKSESGRRKLQKTEATVAALKLELECKKQQIEELDAKEVSAQVMIRIESENVLHLESVQAQQAKEIQELRSEVARFRAVAVERDCEIAKHKAIAGIKDERLEKLEAGASLRSLSRANLGTSLQEGEIQEDYKDYEEYHGYKEYNFYEEAEQDEDEEDIDEVFEEHIDEVFEEEIDEVVEEEEEVEVVVDEVEEEEVVDEMVDEVEEEEVVDEIVDEEVEVVVAEEVATHTAIAQDKDALPEHLRVVVARLERLQNMMDSLGRSISRVGESLSRVEPGTRMQGNMDEDDEDQDDEEMDGEDEDPDDEEQDEEDKENYEGYDESKGNEVNFQGFRYEPDDATVFEEESEEEYEPVEFEGEEFQLGTFEWEDFEWRELELNGQGELEFDREEAARGQAWHRCTLMTEALPSQIQSHGTNSGLFEANEIGADGLRDGYEHVYSFACPRASAPNGT